ncbi:IclR family transcriptional regulator C-terminal domain-containing protein [uncultured Modestobacter sp.]|uniref:IclR family transcriptional regulator domain-containing protein n=1 Tax=uncultured Modestobacter sp. TaxID=380048 RepID=UPI002609E93F|nr:IclR family transcriptional regulator C-terminal domain-containing protein [uncultured Modestobacter sp.]
MTLVDSELPDGDRDVDFIQSLARGLSVIKAFGAESPALTLSDVARATGLTRAAARRSVLTLQQLGYVRAEGALFALTPKVLELGHAYLSGLTIPQVANPHLKRLMRETGETASLSVLDGDHVVHVARVPAGGVITVAINVGARFPAYATAMGRVLLAGLDDASLGEYLARVQLEPRTPYTVRDVAALREVLEGVRRDGYCLADQELSIGLRAIAAPVRDVDGRVVAAANIATSLATGTLEDLRGMLPRLQECATAIERDLLLVTG